MRNLIGIISLLAIYSCAYADLPPTRSAGLGETLKGTFNVYANKNQVTDLGGVTKLFEFGNDNILANADFEGLTAGTGWTSSAGALTRNSSEPLKGLYSLQVALTAQTLNLSQTVASSSSVAGIQAEASIWAKASTGGQVLQFGPKIDGTDSSTSMAITVGTTWQQYVVPFVTGATNNGLFVKSNSAITNNISFDNAKVKLGDVKNTSSVVTAWQSYTPTFTGFGTVTSIEMYWRQVGSSVEIRGRFQNGTNTVTEARISLPNSYTSSSDFTLHQTVGKLLRHASSVGIFYNVIIEPSVGYMTFSCELIAAGACNPMAKVNGTGLTDSNSYSINAMIPIANLSANVSIYSQASQDVSQIKFYNQSNCVPSSTGAVADANDTDCTYAGAEKIGSTLTPSTTGNIALKIPSIKAGKYRFTGNVLLSSSGNATTCGAQWTDGTNVVGPVHTNSQAAGVDGGGSLSASQIVSYSSDQANVEWKLQINRSQGAGTCSAIANGTIASANSGVMLLKLEPISQTITGTFANVVTTPGVASPEMFSVSFGTTNTETICTTPACFIDQIGDKVLSIVHNVPGEYILNTTKTYAKLKCVAAANNLANEAVQYLASATNYMRCENCSSLNFGFHGRSGGPALDVFGTLICHGY